MGGGSFSHTAYRSVSQARASAPVNQVFTQNVIQQVHKDLDPMGVKVRESCDSSEHPESNALGIWFDHTGSMGRAPIVFAKEKLGNLMKILLAKGYIDHPQVLFGCFGDFCDGRGTIQVGQFESDQRIDDCLTKMWLVGGGGGQAKESSELAFYFMAKHTKMDCLEKRGKKGYMFLVTDEGPYPAVSSYQVKEVFGDAIEADVPTAKILEDLKEKFEVFVVFLQTDAYDRGVRTSIRQGWQELLGERVLDLKDPDHVCEVIGTAIGLCEGRDVDGITRDLMDSGSSKDAVQAAVLATALVPSAVAASGTGLSRATVGGGGLPAVTPSSGGTRRL